MGLARRQKEPQRIAQGVDERVDLGAQPTPAAPDRFCAIFRAAVLWRAPSLCW
jgi:hypothetical protein